VKKKEYLCLKNVWNVSFAWLIFFMIVFRRFIFFLACFLLLGKDLSYAYKLSDNLVIHLKEKSQNRGNRALSPFTISDSSKLLLAESKEIEELEDDLLTYSSETGYLLSSLFILTSKSNPFWESLLSLILNRVILFCSLKIDC